MYAGWWESDHSEIRDDRALRFQSRWRWYGNTRRFAFLVGAGVSGLDHPQVYLRYAYFTVQGRVVGKTIVLESEPGLPEGAPVAVEIHYLEPATSAEERLRLVQELFAMNLPVADWEQMEQEAVRGALEE